MLSRKQAKEIVGKFKDLLPDYAVEAQTDHPYIEVCITRNNTYVRFFIQADADDRTVASYAKSVVDKIKVREGVEDDK